MIQWEWLWCSTCHDDCGLFCEVLINTAPQNTRTVCSHTFFLKRYIWHLVVPEKSCVVVKVKEMERNIISIMYISWFCRRHIHPFHILGTAGHQTSHSHYWCILRQLWKESFLLFCGFYDIRNCSTSKL